MRTDPRQTSAPFRPLTPHPTRRTAFEKAVWSLRAAQNAGAGLAMAVPNTFMRGFVDVNAPLIKRLPNISRAAPQVGWIQSLGPFTTRTTEFYELAAKFEAAKTPE